MSTKRYRDPAGLLPDLVQITLDGTLSKSDLANLRDLFDFAQPAAQIERLRRHPELQALADDLARDLAERGGSADLFIIAAIRSAQAKARYLDAAPQVISDRKTKRQRSKAGFSSGKERRYSRQPEWDRWQAMATNIRNKHPKLTRSVICERVGEAFGVTRQAVSRRVRLPPNSCNRTPAFQK